MQMSERPELNRKLDEAIACWKYKKGLQGHNRYESSDLIAIKGKYMKIYEIQERKNSLLTALLDVWEESVRETHLFLSDVEINQIKEYVPQALSGVEHLIIAEGESGKSVAFMGIENKRLEMLFISPGERGKGLGKQLLQYGIKNYDIEEVTVNEQNPQAVGFYKHLGFESYKRTDYDEEGNPYPLLYMKLGAKYFCKK